jgi:hypothetical protein
MYACCAALVVAVILSVLISSTHPVDNDTALVYGASFWFFDRLGLD